MDGPLFRVALKRRLRAPVLDADVFCAACSDCFDRFADHALVCQCKGDRTLRHNAVRDVFFSCAREGSLRPEKEKAGLLPPRPREDGLGANSGTRRPADVWLPRGSDRRGEALDFACSSALRSGLLASTVDHAASVFENYEGFKRTHLDTERIANEAGFQFTPMICEAHSGAWSLTARRVIDRISEAIASTSGEEKHVTSLRVAQRISVALHRANARAILQRVAAVKSSIPERVTDESAAWEAAGRADVVWQ